MTPGDLLARVEGPAARALLRATGGQLWRPEFRLADGRWVRPLAEAPWGEGATGRRAEGLPGHLVDLGGEFVGLPFGGNAEILDPVPGWEAARAGGGPDPMHGPAANLAWRLEGASGASGAQAVAALDLPGLALRRRVTAEGPSIRVELELDAASPLRAPVAFHPNLRLPDRPGGLALEAAFAEGRSYPGRFAHDAMALAPGRRFARLAAAPGRGGPLDLARLPLGPPVDDVALLLGCRPPVVARFLDEGFAVEVDWDPRLPHCMLWLHDRGLAAPPWGGRFRALGVEPMAAAFDLPEALSLGPNPLAAEGWATALDLPAGRTTLWLRLSVSPG